MKRQRFITTIKNVMRRKKNKTLIRFHSVSFKGGGGGENPKESVKPVKT